MEETHYSFFDENPGDFLREHRSYYLMVNAIARRVRQLQTGERALALPPDGNREAVNIAIHEFLEDKLEIIPRRTVALDNSTEDLIADGGADDFDFDIGTLEPSADDDDL